MKIKVLITILMVVFMSGCSKERVAISGEEFYTKATDMEYKVVDNTGQFAYADYVYAVLNKNYTMYFVDGKKSYDIKGIFLDECANVYKKMNDDYDKTTKGGENWTVLKLTDKEKFYYISWIKDTYLFIEAPIEKQKEFEKFADSLGY